MLNYRRPSDYEYALLSQHVYQGNNIQQDDELPDNKSWLVHSVQFGARDYFGAIYVNEETKQVVVAHRGTPGLKILLTEDIQGIYLNWDSPQKHEAFLLVEKAKKYAQKKNFHLSFTGHSLGAFLAELSVYYCHRSFNLNTVNAVTFESPGAKESIEKLLSNHSPLKLEELDIISYLSYPNIVNTCNRHVGTLYSLRPDLGASSWRPDWYTRASHSIDNIVILFKQQAKLEAFMVTDWPLGNERAVFDKYAKLHEGYYQISEEVDFVLANKQRFDLDYKGHFKLDNTLTNQNSLPLRHFPEQLRLFLPLFYSLLSDVQKDSVLREKLPQHWVQLKVPTEITEYLLGYMVVEQAGGIRIVQLSQTGNLLDIFKLRMVLSDWLTNTKPSIIQLLMANPSISDNRMRIIAEVVASGAKVDGKVKGDVVGLQLNLPHTASPETVAAAKELLNHSQTLFKEIRAYIVAPGAVW